MNYRENVDECSLQHYVVRGYLCDKDLRYESQNINRFSLVNENDDLMTRRLLFFFGGN